MKKKIVLRCWLISALSVFLVVAASLGAIYGLSQREIRENLVDSAELFSDLLRGGVEPLDEVQDFGAIRVTVVAEDGEVLFESDTDGAVENHLDREEIAGALADSPRVVTRYSETFHTRMFYYALRVPGQPYVVRVAERTGNLWSFVGASVPFVLLAMLAALVASYFLALRLSTGTERQLLSVRDGLKRLKAGDYRPVRVPMNDSEQFALVGEMNELFAEMRRQDSELRAERAKLSTVVGHVTQGVVALDGERKIVFVNRVARRLFADVPEGRELDYLLDDRALCARLAQALNAEREARFEWNYRGRALVFNVFPTADGEAREIGSMLLVDDVTKEQELLRRKSEFFANASHELKTPLTSLRGLSELLLAGGCAPEQQQRYLRRIHTESLRLNRLVLDMLYISDLENRTLREERERVELAPLAAEAAEEYRQEVEERGLSVAVEGRASLFGDRRNLAAVLSNLIGNAVHYNRPGGSVAVRLSETESGVVMEVADTGIGIAPEHLPKLCERFYRVDKSRSKKTGGTGLGLAIVKHVTALYGGELKFASELGAGTTVTVSLPRGEEQRP